MSTHKPIDTMHKFRLRAAHRERQIRRGSWFIPTDDRYLYYFMEPIYHFRRRGQYKKLDMYTCTTRVVEEAYVPFDSITDKHRIDVPSGWCPLSLLEEHKDGQVIEVPGEPTWFICAKRLNDEVFLIKLDLTCFFDALNRHLPVSNVASLVVEYSGVAQTNIRPGESVGERFNYVNLHQLELKRDRLVRIEDNALKRDAKDQAIMARMKTREERRKRERETYAKTLAEVDKELERVKRCKQ